MKEYMCIASFSTATGRRYFTGERISEDEYNSLYYHQRRWFRIIGKVEESDLAKMGVFIVPDEPRQDDTSYDPFQSPPQEDDSHKFSGFDHGSFGGAGAGSSYDSPSSHDSHDSGYDSSDSSSNNDD